MSSTENAAAISPKVPSSLSFLEINVDCFEELFDWLTLTELRALRRTCKLMKKVVNYWILMKYPRRFGKLEICDTDAENIQDFDRSFFELYKHIKFDYYPLNKNRINGIKPILAEVEKVTINNVNRSLDFYGQFLQFCPKLKSLCIGKYELFSTFNISFDWLSHHYPTLEHFALKKTFYAYSSNKFPTLQTFFQKNPNVRRFSTDSDVFVRNSGYFKEANVDQLDIDVSKIEAVIINVLHTVYRRGFYKKLHFYLYSNCEQEHLNEIARCDALEKLYLGTLASGIVWPCLKQLKEFSIYFDTDIVNIDMLVNSIVNIERIYLREADFEKLLPFFHGSQNLKELKIDWLTNGAYSNDGLIDLRALNEERKKCASGSKITIYVAEHCYLKTKMSTMETNYGLIELKRSESIVWDYFGY